MLLVIICPIGIFENNICLLVFFHPKVNPYF
nr:chloroplast envelope membrane protein [Potamogeton crispus]WAI96268.1 chloroplast envelope membrane protein [Potamogeton crispus]